MSGKKQHFIPQHFQRPFLMPDAKDKIWLYRHDRPDGIPVSLKKSAAKEHFYSKLSSDGSKTLDDLVTEYEENNLTGKVDSIRELPIGSEIYAEDIAEIVTHLSIRSAYLREFINEGAKSMVGAIEQLINSPDQFETFSTRNAHQVPAGLQCLVEDVLKEHGILSQTNVSKAAIARLVYFYLRENIDNIRNDASKQFAIFLERFSEHIRNMGKVAHTELLQSSMAPDARVKQLLDLDWRVEEFAADNAILPDCTSIAFDGEKWMPLILSDSKAIKVVVLPLAPNRLAVGRINVCDPVDISNYNELAANACFHFFLSNQKSDEFKDWISGLGGQLRAELSTMTVGAMDDVLHNLFHGSDSLGGKSSNSNALSVNNEVAHSVRQEEIRYVLTLNGCGDQASAEKLSAQINPVILFLVKAFPMDGLDAITFAHDYRSGINEVDRGFERVCEIVPFEEGDKIGMGMPITIIANGKIKTHIVLRECVGADLLSTEKEVAVSALAVVVYTLGACILTETIQQRFPEQVMKPLESEYEGFLAKKTNNVVCAYFSTRISSWVKNHADYYAADALEALHQCHQAILLERKNYGNDCDHEKLYEKVSKNLATVMEKLAHYFAAKAEMKESCGIRKDLKDCLISYQLYDWAILFEKDLMAFHLNIGVWADYDECFFVNRHLERLLMQFGIIFDQLETGELYVHVNP